MKHEKRRPIPLSASQEAMWLDIQGTVAADFHPYIIVEAHYADGPLNPVILAQALQRIAGRQEAIRTRILVGPEGPVQEILEQVDWPLEIRADPVSPGPEAERAFLSELAYQERVRGFQLDTAPLFRATLIRLANQRHALVIARHHLVSDGLSGDILRAEMAELHDALSSARPIDLPEIAVQPSDVAREQAREDNSKQLEYWTELLERATFGLALPRDRESSTENRSCEFTRALPAALALKTRSFGRVHGVTVTCVLQAALLALLQRYSGQDDVLLSVAFTWRYHADAEWLIGDFVNRLPLRARFRPGIDFSELVADLFEQSMNMQDNGQVGMHEILRELRAPPEARQIRVEFTATTNQGDALSVGALTWRREIFSSDQIDGDVCVTSSAGVDGISMGWAYAQGRFDRSTIERMATNFETLLDGLLSAPHATIDSVPTVSPAERDVLLAGANGRVLTGHHAEPLLVHELFRERARESPDAPAMYMWNGRVVSYRELEQHARAIAQRLVEMHVRPGDVVAICSERCVARYAAVLAVLQIGAVFLPLDPRHPADRLRYYANDANAKAVLQTGSAPTELADGRTTILDLDEVDATGVRDQVVPPITPDHTAYVIYTSGSTGRPKGVMVSHGSLANYLQWLQHTFKLTVESRVLQSTACTFDPSLLEIFWPLTSGAAVVVPAPEGQTDARHLFELMLGQRVTHINFVPSFLRVVLKEAGGRRLPSLQCAFVGGERLTLDVARQLFDQLPNIRLYNFYGPTETTIDCTYWKCSADAARVLIGRPIANASVYVLNPAMQLAPIGAPGELYVGGRPVAQGYLKRPSLTSDRFLADPFCARPGARMYRTGDVVRMLASGDLEFIGRGDQQVKVRGQRIELGEIENAMTRHLGVSEAVVIAHKDPRGDHMLVGFFVPTATFQAVSEPILRRHLAGTLPRYMIPARLHQIDKLPRLGNDKLDRDALAERARSMARATADHASPLVAPRTRTEQILAEIWQVLFELREISVDADFFAQGGHSLTMIRMRPMVQDRFAVDVSFRDLYEYATIIDLAHRIDQLRRAGSTKINHVPLVERFVSEASPAVVAELLADLRSSDLVPLHALGHCSDERDELVLRLTAQHEIDISTRPLAHYSGNRSALVHVQRLFWDLHQLRVLPSMATLPVVLKIHDVDQDALESAVRELVDRQSALRTAFLMTDDGLVQEVQKIGTDGLYLERVDVSHAGAGALELASQHLNEARTGLQLTHRSFRAILFDIGEKTHVLTCIPHHIICDGFSQRLLADELQALYARHLNPGSMEALPPLEFEYRDFCRWQLGLLQRPLGAQQKAFWQSYLRGVSSRFSSPELVSSLPATTFSRGLEEFPRLTIDVDITGESWVRLGGASARYRVTPYTILLAAFLATLRPIADQDDLCVHSGYLSRDRHGSDQVIGNFVSNYAIRVVVTERTTSHELIENTQEQVLRCRDNHGIGFTFLSRTQWQVITRFNFNYQVVTPRSIADEQFGTEFLDWTDVAEVGHELAIFLYQMPDGVRGQLVANGARFGSRREQLGREFERTVSVLCDHENRPVVSTTWP